MSEIALSESTSLQFFRDVIALAKPRITFMVLCTMLGGLWVAPGHLHAAIVVAALFGVMLVSAGSSALNMYLERDVDGLMTRTRNRPLPAERLQPEVALTCGISWSITGVVLLTFSVNPLTGFLAGFSIIMYVLAYTPLKRRSTTALLVGAVPGAMPPLLGWTAATGSLDKPGLILFLVLFLWQLPHFIAISLFRVDEYRAAGLKILPVERGVAGAKQRVALYSALMVLASLEVIRLGMAGRISAWAVYLLGLSFLGISVYGLKASAGRRWARTLFIASLVYLPLYFLVLVVAQG